MKKKSIFKNYLFMSFFLSFILGCLIILPNTIVGKGLFSLVADYNTQQILFGKIANYSLKSGSYLWTWFNDLGSDFIATFSFYNLFSPFSLIAYLFPADWIPIINPFLIIIKFSVSGLTSYLFLKRYVRDGKLAVLGSLLYSFCGFQFTSILFHMYDSVVLFPLLLYTLDNLVYDGKKLPFALCVALNAFTNWFMFIGQVVFVIIYYLVKVLSKDYKFSWRQFFTVLLEGVLGTLLASFVLIPSFLFTVSNPRVSNSWTLLGSLKYNNFSHYVEIFRAFFFPSEIMYPRAFLNIQNYGSVDFYLPFVGSVLGISYILKKPKSWISILMVTCVFIMMIPILNSMFFLFTTTYYARWFYMPVLIMSLASLKCLEDNIKTTSGFLISISSLFLIILFYFVLRCIHPNIQYIHDIRYIFMMIGAMVINLVMLFLIFKFSKNKVSLIILGVMIFSGFWGNYTIYKYRGNKFNYDEYFNNYINSYKEIKFNEFVRSNATDSCLPNMGLVFKNSNLNSFNSNISGSAFEFYKSIDYDRSVSTYIDYKNRDLNNFLSVKYIISCNDSDLSEFGYELDHSTKNYNIYVNHDFREMGLVFNKYISNDEFMKYSTGLKTKSLNESIILSNEQIKKYGNLYDSEVNIKSNKFKYINNGFKSSIDLSGDTLILYTVPYDEGWRATINGRAVSIEKVDNGFMAVKGNKGSNKIVFSYYPKGLNIGLVMSCLSLSGLIFYKLKSKH